MTEIFISYRRENAHIVDHVHDKLSQVTRAGAVFVDRIDIRPGMAFPDRLREALSEAHLILVFIGRDWISAQDPMTYRRRLDMEDDWVRVELDQALREEKKIIPVLLEGAKMPERQQLPDCLQKLVVFNAVNLSIERFRQDVDSLVVEIARQLGEEGVAKLTNTGQGKFPPIPGFVPTPLTQQQISDLLADLSQWKLVKSDLLDDDRFDRGYKRIELVRELRFPSFKDAVRFMAYAVESIEYIGHHPRWENVFRTVTVHFSTWDIGHRPSDRDYRAAKNIERCYEAFMKELAGRSPSDGGQA